MFYCLQSLSKCTAILCCWQRLSINSQQQRMHFSKTLDNYHSTTRESQGSDSRTHSVHSSILVRDLDTSLCAKPLFNLVTRDIHHGLLTQFSDPPEVADKVQLLTVQNHKLTARIQDLESLMREESENHGSNLRLKEIAQSEYICGMKSMYERNTQMSEQIIVYERELKNAMYTICQLETQLEQTQHKSISRANKQHQLEDKVQEAEERHRQQFATMKECYERERVEQEAGAREIRFQNQTLKEDLNKERAERSHFERLIKENNDLMSSQKDNADMELSKHKDSILRLETETANLRHHVKSLETSNQQLSRSSRLKGDEKCIISETLASNTIAALAIENVTLKQEQDNRDRAIYLLEDKVQAYERQRCSTPHSRQISFTRDIPINRESHLNKQNQYSQPRARGMFSSVDRHNQSFCSNVYELTRDPVWGSIVPVPLNMAKQVGKKEKVVERSRRREGANNALLRRCSQINKSLFL